MFFNSSVVGATVLLRIGVVRWTVPSSERSEQNGADESKDGRHHHHVQSHGKVHVQAPSLLDMAKLYQSLRWFRKRQMCCTAARLRRISVKCLENHWLRRAASGPPNVHDRGMERASAAKGDENEIPRIPPSLDCD